MSRGAWLGGVALALLFACSRNESEPVAVARAYADAARRADVDAMMKVMESAAVEELERAAEKASDQVGGRRAIEATEMLQIVGVDRSLAVARAELVGEDGHDAQVELTLTDGRSVVVHLVWEATQDDDPGGAWKVRVPLPTTASVPSQPDA